MQKSSESHFHEFRGLRHHVRTWGEPRHPKLFLLHGWMDVSASFQFLVDCFERDWHVIAPDWRGFGLSEWQHDGYWFPDYYADLDHLLDLYQSGAPVDIVGHSMGGMVACTYAGVRPERVRRLVSLEGFGLGRTSTAQAPARLRQWLDDLRDPPRFRPYRSYDEVGQRLKSLNPRLTDARAAFLARHWAQEAPGGEVVLRSDPRHKVVNPYLYRLDEMLACWREVTAPVLWVFGRKSQRGGYLRDTPDQLDERRRAFRDFHETWIEDCGHMMHHDQPERLARVIEAFLAR
jgi:pimeloyl-ACP methyl ester carboxylesterase